MSLPKVTIVIPVYNGANFLGEAIDSALAQTYPNLEVVVVNDGSDDGGATAAVAHSFGGKIRYFEKANGGVASALNLGIAAMRGELFSWLSHDDLYLPTKVEVQVAAYLDHGAPCVVFGDFTLIEEDGRLHRTIDLAEFAARPINALLRAMFNGCAFLIPRAILLELGGFLAGLPTTQDYELWSRLLDRLPFVHSPHRLVRQRLHPMQGSREASHADEASRLMVQALDRLTPETMAAYEGSVEAFLLRWARVYRSMPYAGAKAYFAFRARQQLLQTPHTVALLPNNASRSTHPAPARTLFAEREWIAPGARPVSALIDAAAHDYVYLGADRPTDAQVVSALAALIEYDASVAVPEGATSLDGVLVRRSALPPTGAAVFDAPHWRERFAAGAVRQYAAMQDADLDPPARLDAIRERVLGPDDFAKLIDCDWYRDRYHLGAASRDEIWADYFGGGWRVGRDPSPWFNARFYRRQGGGSPEANENPLFHYLARGATEGRTASPRLAPFATVRQNASARAPDAPVPAFKIDEPPHPDPVETLGARFANDLPTLLFVCHSGGGGTLVHMKRLVAMLGDRANALFLFGDAQRLVLTAEPGLENSGFSFRTAVDEDRLVTILRRIGVDRADVYHTLGFEDVAERILTRLRIPYDMTLVDYHSVALRLHLTGANGCFFGEDALAARDPAIVRTSPLPTFVNAERRIAISRDVAARYARLAPQHRVLCASSAWMKPAVDSRDVYLPRLWPGDRLRILVNGQVSHLKGSDMVIRVATLAEEQDLPLQIHLLGRVEPGVLLPALDTLNVHGSFDSADLESYIGRIAPHLAWFPAKAPETWCYALSEAMAASLPVVANALGAFVERCHGRALTWLLPWQAGPQDALDLFRRLYETHLRLPAQWASIDGLPAVEPFGLDDYLKPARMAAQRRRSGRPPVAAEMPARTQNQLGQT